MMRKRIKLFLLSLLVLFCVLGYGIINQIGTYSGFGNFQTETSRVPLSQNKQTSGNVSNPEEKTTEKTSDSGTNVEEKTSENISDTEANPEEKTSENISDTEANTEDKTNENVNTNVSNNVTLKMIGDMLLHATVQNTGFMPDGTYNYDHFFTHIREDIQSADIAIVNQEVIIGGNDIGIQTYPCFNCLEEVGDAIVKAGFDVVLHATNHTMDRGQKAVDHCIDFWAEKYPQIACLGMNKTAEDAENITVYEKNGIKIAMLNYTYGLNGIALPSDRAYLVNMLTGSNEAKIRKDIEKAKELSDFVIVFPHWGTEYVYEPDSNQKYWTRVFAECGVDLVLGTHPHVIEPVEWIDRQDGGRMLVYYSLGNFISDQKKAPRMLGAMAEVILSKNENGVVTITDYGVVPLVTHEVHGEKAFTTYKLKDYTEELAMQNYILQRDASFSISMMQDLCRRVFPSLYS